MTWEEFSAYVYFFYTVLLVVLLYGYIYHLYKNQKSGKRDYEKYSKMALDDELTSKPVEKIEKNENKEEA